MNRWSKVDPDFTAIKTRLIYGEIYPEQGLPPKLWELVILAVAAANRTMGEVQRYTAATLSVGALPEEIKEAVYHCAPYIGMGKAGGCCAPPPAGSRGGGSVPGPPGGGPQPGRSPCPSERPFSAVRRPVFTPAS